MSFQTSAIVRKRRCLQALLFAGVVAVCRVWAACRSKHAQRHVCGECFLPFAFERELRGAALQGRYACASSIVACKRKGKRCRTDGNVFAYCRTCRAKAGRFSDGLRCAKRKKDCSRKGKTLFACRFPQAKRSSHKHKSRPKAADMKAVICK